MTFVKLIFKLIEAVIVAVEQTVFIILIVAITLLSFILYYFKKRK